MSIHMCLVPIFKNRLYRQGTSVCVCCQAWGYFRGSPKCGCTGSAQEPAVMMPQMLWRLLSYKFWCLMRLVAGLSGMAVTSAVAVIPTEGITKAQRQVNTQILSCWLAVVERVCQWKPVPSPVACRDVCQLPGRFIASSDVVVIIRWECLSSAWISSICLLWLRGVTTGFESSAWTALLSTQSDFKNWHVLCTGGNDLNPILTLLLLLSLCSPGT